MPQARTDPGIAALPLVTGDLGLEFHEAAPIITAGAYRLGTVAVMDNNSHEWTPEQLAE